MTNCLAELVRRICALAEIIPTAAKALTIRPMVIVTID